jgi:hypothetical protein
VIVVIPSDMKWRDEIRSNGYIESAPARLSRCPTLFDRRASKEIQPVQFEHFVRRFPKT